MALEQPKTMFDHGELSPVECPLIQLSTPELLSHPDIQELFAFASDFENSNVINNLNSQAHARRTYRAAGALPIDPSTRSILTRNPSIVPNKGLFTDQFYWDTERIIDGWLSLDLSQTPEARKNRLEIIRGAVDNFEDVFNTTGRIPNRMHLDFANRSQPPVFTTVIMDTYEEWQKMTSNSSEKAAAKKWLKGKMATAEREYKTWALPDSESGGKYNHKVDDDSLLSRWGFSDVEKDTYTIICETGNDQTHEYGDNPHNFHPVLLNALLARYEADFAEAARIMGNEDSANAWDARRNARIMEMNQKMWNSEAGWFFNYDAKTQEQSTYMSLNGFMPMALGLVTPDQAEQMVQNLWKFDLPFGLAMATANEKQDTPYQWDRPNVWANMVEFVCEGIDRYANLAHGGERERYFALEADIRRKSLASSGQFYQRYHTTPERLNGITGENGDIDHYDPQINFGWTNAHIMKSKAWFESHPQYAA